MFSKPGADSVQEFNTYLDLDYLKFCHADVMIFHSVLVKDAFYQLL